MMLEPIVQLGPMLILAGLAAGWIAEAITRTGGWGATWDMTLGVIGSVVVGVTVWLGVSGGAGMATMFLIGCGGAALLIVAQRSVWRRVGVGT
jgi:uncharacterized membrane protein YeaQ/YmgE (transglycosylase-associated protein family)